MRKRIKYLVALLAATILLGFYFYWTKPDNYLHPTLPIYLGISPVVCDSSAGEYADFTVFTYNIKHGKKIKEATKILTDAPYLANRIIFLQEVHTDAVDHIANSLGMYSVYFPLNKGFFSNQDFGNAILSTVPLLEPQKIIFPHGQSHNGRRRGMTCALACLGGKTVLLGSVHASTVILSSDKRREQIQYLKLILQHYSNVVDNSIIGGDFNAVQSSYRTYIKDELASIGYNYNSLGLGTTHSAPLSILDAELDIIFCNGCNVTNTGVIRDGSASDHYPVWVDVVGLAQ